MNKVKNVVCTLPEELVAPMISEQELSKLNVNFVGTIEELCLNQVQSTNCEILWIGLQEKLTKQLLRRLPSLEIVMTSTTGTTHIEIEELHARRIALISLKDLTHKLVSITSTPELGWGLFIAAHRKIVLADRNKHHVTKYRELYFAPQISNQRIGIIGFGRIGQRISNYARAFEADTYYYDPKVANESFAAKFTSLEWIVENCDAIFVCASKNDAVNEPILGRELVGKLKSNAILINVSRGSLLDEKAILESLERGRIRGYATDVLQIEETMKTSSISETDLMLAKSRGLNLIVTPHIGGASEQAIMSVNRLVLDQLWDRIGC